MPEFEVTFRTLACSQVQEDYVVDQMDGFVGGHGDITLITLSDESWSAVDAGRRLAAGLIDQGVDVIRVEPDLVNAATIAKRVGLSRQAVGNWVRGARRAGTAFPTPTLLCGGGLWRWEEVDRWRRANGHGHDDVDYLTADDEIEVDAWLLRRRGMTAGAATTWRHLATAPSLPLVEVSSASTTAAAGWGSARLVAAQTVVPVSA